MDSGSALSALESEARLVVRRAFGCSAELAETIVSQARVKSLPRGQQLWPIEGRDETTLLTVGRAQEVAYGRDGGMLVLHMLGPGEFFGNLMGESDSELSAEVEAVVESAGAMFATSTVVRLMETNHGVAMAISRQLAGRIAAMRRRMVESALLSATGRISAELLRLARDAADRTIRPRPVLSDLAVTVQSTRETVSRTISQLEKRGILQRVEGGLRVVAPHRLEELVY
jgi:CRP-like cAMP-binding protein